MSDYSIIIESDEEDLMQRVEIMNAALFRALTHSILVRVLFSDYRSGMMQVIVAGPPKCPALIEGHAEVTMMRLDKDE